jgi:hypothetical protein
MAQHFTVSQAESLLPLVEQAIRDAIELKKFYIEAEQVLEQESRRITMSGGAMVNQGKLQAERSRRDTCAQQLNQAIEKIHSYGCEVKDLDIGLIDFRTWYQGEEVYLCWRLGETGITHWHGITEGFPGRKIINDEFIREHHGDRVA